MRELFYCRQYERLSRHRCNIAVIIRRQKGTINDHCDINCQAAPPPVRCSGRWQLPPIGAAIAEIWTNQIASLILNIALQQNHKKLSKTPFSWINLGLTGNIQISNNENFQKDQDRPIGLKTNVAAAMAKLHRILLAPPYPSLPFRW